MEPPAMAAIGIFEPSACRGDPGQAQAARKLS
jgi:hypothetical protein